MKKVSTILLLLSICGFVNAQFAGGTGISTDPYQITTAAHLNNVRNYLGNTYAGTYFKMMNDIDLSSYPNWTPIGEENALNTFYGNFNGDNHWIFSLSITIGTSAGLFGCVGNTGVVKNLNILLESLVKGQIHVGSLVAANAGTVQYCSVTGTGVVIDESGLGGGLIGQNSGTVANCSSTVQVSASWTSGGLVGQNWGGLVTNCYARGSVTGGGNRGGLVGQNEAGSTISNCYSTGFVGADSPKGGLVSTNLGTVTNSFWDTETSVTTESQGGTGKTTSEMKTQSTFTDAGWDFLGETANGYFNYWGRNDGTNNGYPYLAPYPVAPTEQASGLVFTNISDDGATIEWTRGNGDNCVVFAKQTNTGQVALANATTYNPSVLFGSGSQADNSGWFCVYNGNGTSVDISDLEPGSTYRLMVCEYNGSAGIENYLTTTNTDNPNLDKPEKTKDKRQKTNNVKKSINKIQN